MIKKNMLITGATGFIGRNVAEYFANKENFNVYGTYNKSKPIENKSITMIKADLTRTDEVNSLINNMDVIVQAAATTSGAKDTFEKPYYHVTDNVVMNSLIFRSANLNNVSHVIFFSCSVMYRSSDKPLKETAFNPSEKLVDKYFGVAKTKLYIEDMCDFYSRIGNTKFTAIRHSNIYGPYDKFDLERSHVFGATVTKVLTAKDNKITIWGTGEEERDLLYISDLVDFVEHAINNQTTKFGLYNVGYGESISINDLVKKIIEHSGKNLSIEHDLTKPTIPTKFCLDSTKAQEELGWSKKISLDDGIKKTIEWYLDKIKI